jgi:hypothetical protein
VAVRNRDNPRLAPTLLGRRHDLAHMPRHRPLDTPARTAKVLSGRRRDGNAEHHRGMSSDANGNSPNSESTSPVLIQALSAINSDSELFFVANVATDPPSSPG